jgi:hypothetical protein
MITDKTAVVGHWLLVVGYSCQPKLFCQCKRQTFKEREDEVSQLNRLVGLLSYLLFPISAYYFGFRRRTVVSLAFTSAQVLADH